MVETGGRCLRCFWEVGSSKAEFEGEPEVGCGAAASETVFTACFESDLDTRVVEEVGRDLGGGKPEMTGGGKSSPSVAFFDSCRAKSDACHHSRNFSANIDAGRRSFRLDSSFGYMTEVKVAGLKMLDPWPGRAPARGVRGSAARAIARWSASPSRRIRIPISHRKGEEYFVLSKR